MNTSYTLITALFFNFFSMAAAAQDVATADVPYDIKETMFARFQKVTDAKWKKTKPDVYHVTFKKGDKNLQAEFGDDGRWLSTIYTISVNELPREVIASVAKKMPGHKMKKALRQETLMRGTIFTVTTQKDSKTYEFTFNPSGKLLFYTEPEAEKAK